MITAKYVHTEVEQFWQEDDKLRELAFDSYVG